ncbi:SDR family oxidoreductase [bacterium]|nr:SDR family oxidoreductase [bacterium]
MKTDEVKSALIIGGGSGMGKAIALKLGGLGINTFVADFNREAVDETVQQIQTEKGTAGGFSVDISDSSSVFTLFQAIRSHADRLDLMVDTAAVLGKVSFIEDMEDDDWRKVMSVNLDGTFFCCREAVRWMKEHQTGRIILFSSVASQMPTPGSLHYSASKAGVNMLGKTLAKEVAKYNIRVNMIAPGYIKTPMLKEMPDGFTEYVVKKTPIKRLGEVEEIAGLVAFLASPEADFFTGQLFGPNGGWVI